MLFFYEVVFGDIDKEGNCEYIPGEERIFVPTFLKSIQSKCSTGRKLNNILGDSLKVKLRRILH
jgi:hypothetical protein